MPNEIHIPSALQAKINAVANQIQCRRLMHCWVRFGCFTLALVAIGTALLWLTEILSIPRFWPSWLLAGMEVAAFWGYVLRPMRHPVTREQVALFMEENHPGLENRLVSAIEFETAPVEGSPPWIINQFFQDTDQIVKPVTFSELLDPDLLTKLLVSTATFLFFSGVIVILFHSIWLPSLPSIFHKSATARPRITLTVEPGDARVRQGDNQTILSTTSSEKQAVTLHWQSGDQPWQSENMAPSVTQGVYYHTFIAIQNDIHYAVQTGDIRSPAYTLKTWYPPKLESIDVTYRYPSYLGIEPKSTPNAGSISAVEGTEVQITAWVNKKLQSARIVFNATGARPLQENTDTSWTVSFPLTENLRFTIPLTDLEGEKSEFDPAYEITVQQDRPPEITLDFPHQDLEADILEEIPIEFHVKDDFTIGEYGLQYEIAGREPVLIPLSATSALNNEAHALTEIRLEEWNLSPGDLITWAVWAKDRKPDRDTFEILSDPFFIEIRPFRRSYENAISNAGANHPQQNGENSENQDATSQKEILIATWNLRREVHNLESTVFQKKRTAIAEAQKKLVERYSHPDNAPPGGPQLLPQLLDTLQQAVKELETSGDDPAKGLDKAMVQEQKAYRLILTMRPDRSQVQQQRARGNNASQNSPDISELEIDRKRNFYEEEQRSQQQLHESDEALNNIKDLTHRQKVINDEIAKLISESKKETLPEEMKRQLERLQEEEHRNLQKLDEMQSQLAMNGQRDSRTSEALRQMDNVRQQMNRGLEQMQHEQLQEARVSGSHAVNALDRMGEQIQQLSQEGAAQRMTDLQTKMDELISKEQSITKQIQEFKKDQESPALALDPKLDEKKEALRQEKDQLAKEFINLISEANDLAEKSKQSQELFSRRLGDWMRETSRRGIHEDIQNEQTLPLIHYGIWDSALERENQIADKLKESAEELNRVAQSLVANDLEGMQLALNQLKELMQAGKNAGTGTVQGATSEIAIHENPNLNNGAENPQSQNPSRGASGQGNQSPGIASALDNRENWPMPNEIRSPDSMRQFVETEYRDWTDRLRNAEQLIPDGNPSREPLTQLRESIEELRRDFNRNRQPPPYDLFIERVASPLLTVAKELENQVKAILSQEEFTLTLEGDVPNQYQDQVAEYFRNLSESKAEQE